MNLNRTLTTVATGTVATLAATVSLAGCAKPVPDEAPITIAVTATSHETAPALSGPVRDTLTAYATHAQNPGAATVTILVQGKTPTQFDLTPMRGKKVEAIGTKKATKIADRMRALDATLGDLQASSPGLDTLGLYDQALQNTHAGGTVIMQTSGISTTDPVDLTKAGNWMDNPAQFADQIKQANIPDATGRNIIWVGIGYGDPRGEQPTAGPAARAALRTIWSTICQRSHATTCTILDGPAGTTPPGSSNTVPTVSFDQIKTHCIGDTTLSADVAFEPNSAVLRPQADAILQPLAHALKACPAGRTINAIGHTAEVPGGGNGITLSTQRATAVLTRLRQLGAPETVIGTATGYGDTRPLVDNTPDGVYDEALARHNRVVELTITG